MTPTSPRTVVLVHGLRTSATMWRRQVELLRALGHDPRAIDLPGHGSRMDERFTLEEAVASVDAAVRDAAHPVVVVGFSLGGYTTIEWAGRAERPAVRGLLAAGCGTRPWRPVLAGWRAAARVIHAFPDRGRALNDWAVRAAVRDPELARDVIRGGVALEVMDDALREVRAFDPAASLTRVAEPVWLVNGTLDHFRLEDRRFARAAPRGRLIHVSGATHMVSLTRPDVFDRILLAALDAWG